MTWTKLSDDFDQHPKIIAAGERAELLHIHGLIYCNRHLTDGHIPSAAVRRMLAVNPDRSVQRLVELGIWVPVEDGFQIHDFLDYQPSRAKVLAEHEQKASAGQAGGVAAAKARAIAKSQAEPVAKSKPVPVPVPRGSLDPSSSTDKSTSADNSTLVGTSSQRTNGLRPMSETLPQVVANLKVEVQ